MTSFCANCSALLTDDLIRRLLVTTDACLAMLPTLVFIMNNVLTVFTEWFGEEECIKQARIHTGFHRFTEIGQIFHNIYFFNKSKFQD